MENLVVLPGWTRDKNSYEKLINSAPANFVIFIPSYDVLAPYKGLTYFEKELLNYLKKNNLDKINLLGHSFGGTLAIDFASKYPEKIKNLYLVDSGIISKRKLSKVLARFLKEHFRKGVYLNVLDLIRVLRNPVANYKSAFTAYFLDLRSEVKKITVPTLLIWGGKDAFTPINQAKTLQKHIPNSKLIKLENVDHDWILYNPEHLWQNIVF